MLGVKPELTMRVLEAPPPDRWCDSGHSVSEDAIYQEGPVRFFSLSGNFTGTYCELCIVLANELARRRKHGSSR